MKESNLTFGEGFLGAQARAATKKGNTMKTFDWDNAAVQIKEYLKEHPELIAEAGLQGDWNYTGGIIFEKGVPTNKYYTYLTSNWAIPTLILSWDGEEQKEIECFMEESERGGRHNQWDDISIALLAIKLKDHD